MAVKAFSSVSVIDFTDVGNIQLYLTSNQPTTVVYNPNSTGTAAYTPSWASSPNLVITPVIAYNGQNISNLGAQGLTITYTRKVGSGTPTALTTGETIGTGDDIGKLKVTTNKLSTTDNLLTYICSITYTDPETGVPLMAEASLTYTLLQMATELKSCEITGENVFLYDSDRNIIGSNSITLTATLSHVSITQWQYKNSEGDYVAFPTTYNSRINDNTIVVNANDVVFVNRTASIKLVTSDSSVYDIHVISKIYDGAAGTDTVSAVLTNENHYLPCNSSGQVLSWNGAESTIHIYEAGEEVTDWSISTNLGNGLSGTYSSSTQTFTPSAITVDSSYVDFVCTKTGYSTITKRFTLTKVQQGADGHDAVIFECIPSVYAINLDESGNYIPSTVTFYGYRTQGESSRSSYSGRFKVYTSTDGNTFTLVDTSLSNEAFYEYTPLSSSITMIKCELYEAGATTKLLDTQSVVITRDGTDGDPGHDGKNGVSMGLGNYQDVVPCTTAGNASAAKTINIPFYAYAGITRIPVTATIGTLPSGVSVHSPNGNIPGTVSANGLLVLDVANGATFGNSSTMSGEITITLQATYEGQTQSLEQKFTWTKSKQSANGVDAVILQIYSLDGGAIRNSSGSTTLTALLTSGTGEVTDNASIEWKKYSGGSYVSFNPKKTGETLTVTSDMVNDLAFFKCEALYGDRQEPYVAYYTVDDITDPYTAYTFATVSEFKNGQGYGAIYTRIYQNGVEVDPILSTTFSDTAPTSPSNGDYYYHLDTNLKTCTLKKYNGSSWSTQTENNIFNYKYYRMNKDGDSLDASPWKTTRTFYVDPSMINGRMQFICEVTD